MVKFDVISILCCEPAVYIHDKDHPSYKQFHVRAPSDTATPPTRRRRGRGFRDHRIPERLRPHDARASGFWTLPRGTHGLRYAA